MGAEINDGLNRQKPLTPVRTIKYAIVGLMILLNAAYFIVIKGDNSSSQLHATSISFNIFWIMILIVLFVIASKCRSFITNMASKQPDHSESLLRGLQFVMMMFFELGGLFGFCSVFVVNSSLYLVTGSLFTVWGVMFFVPDNVVSPTNPIQG